MNRGKHKQGAALPRGSNHAPAPAADAVETNIARARVQRRRGDRRKALVLLREACTLDEWRARSFTLLGVWLAEQGKRGEAVRALEHARWLRARAGEAARAQATQGILDRIAAAA